MAKINAAARACLWCVVLVMLVVGFSLQFASQPAFQTVCYPLNCECERYYDNNPESACVFYQVDLVYRESGNKEDFAPAKIEDSYMCPSNNGTICWVREEDEVKVELVPESNLKESAVGVIFTLAGAMIWPLVIIDCIFEKEEENN